MKKIYKYYFVFLSAFLMTVSLSAFAGEPEKETGTDAIHLDKKIEKTGTDEDTYTITLETFVTGSSITTVTTEAKPVDLVLVLDVSTSMDDDITSSHVYSKVESRGYSFNSINSSTYYIKDGDNYYPVVNVTNEDVGEEYTYYYLYYTRNSTTRYLYGTSTTTNVDDVKDIRSADATIYTGSLYRNNGVDSNGTKYSYNYIYNNVRYLYDGSWRQVQAGIGHDKYDGYNLQYTDANNVKHLLAASDVFDKDEIIWTGELYTQVADNSKLKRLKIAVDSFIDVVASKATQDNVDHRISLVKFAADNRNVVGNDTYTAYWWTQYNYSQIVCGFKSPSDYDDVRDYVDDFISGGVTRSDYGMNHAKTLINSIDDDRESNKVVVMFTDGSPTSNSYDFNTNVANNAICYSKDIKALGAKVYTIGIFDDETTNIRTYMNYVSSNYPNASDMNTPGIGGSADGGYYQLSDGSDLTAIFESIANEETDQTDGYPLDATSTSVIDIVSDNFYIPSGAANVQFSVESCYGYTDEDGYLWAKSGEDNYYYVPDPAVPITATIKNDTLKVTGFDFTKDDSGSGSSTVFGNWVGPRKYSTGTTVYKGNKLVISFDVKLNPDYVGGYAMPSNDINSGIYVDGNLIKPYPRPHVDFPSICIVKDGLAVGESAIFHVTADYFGADGETDDVLDLDSYVVLTQREVSETNHNKERCYVTLKQLYEGVYTVEETDWAWMYTTSPQNAKISYTVLGANKVDITLADMTGTGSSELKVNGGSTTIGRSLNKSISISSTETQNIPFVLLADALADESHEYDLSAISVLYLFTNTRVQSGKPARAEAFVHNQFQGGKATAGTETGSHEEEDI